LTQATMPGACQMRSKTQSPCLHRAVVEIRGIPLCEGCAREQEAYFAIGELTQETQELGGLPLGKTLGEALDGMRRHRAHSLAAAKRPDLPGVDETECLALTDTLTNSYVSGSENRGAG
jgi:hypothetical protein